MDADRLSALPDGTLLHILSFLDGVKDTARTSVLSRRWRTLWCQQDAIDLYDADYDDGEYEGEKVGRLLFRDAMAIVGASGRCPVRTLSLFVRSYHESDFVEDVMATSPGMDAVLAAPAMQRLTELCIMLEAEFSSTCDAYELPPSRMPHECLRVLELTGCTLGPAGNAVFGCLEMLRMESCVSSMANLQAMLDAAPNLTSLWIKYVFFKDKELGLNWYDVVSKQHGWLRCPASVVDVALIDCHRMDGLDLEAPNISSLRYKGYLEHFPFSTQSLNAMPNPIKVDVSFCKTGRCGKPPSQEIQRHAFFWESIGTFSHLQHLKLKLEYIGHIAVHHDQEHMLLNKVFTDLKLLEVEGSRQVDSYGASVTIANLLQCCPAVQEFRLKTSLHWDPYGLHERMIQSEERRAQFDLEKSMDSLTLLKSKQTCPSSDVDNYGYDDMELTAFESCRFPCLLKHLRKIRLQFNMECFKCFEVKLAKFLVENAVVLEEMEVHDGDQRLYNHIHHKLAEWRANSFVGSKTKIVGEHGAVTRLDWDDWA